MTPRPTDATPTGADTIDRAICAETCAYVGEPPCWSLPSDWPNPDCDEPGCSALADAAWRQLNAALTPPRTDFKEEDDA
jgi:hypothetical protein